MNFEFLKKRQFG